MTRFFPISCPSLTELESDYVMRALRSGWISSLGEYIDAFERGFAEFCGTKHAICVSNGTTALHLSLMALGIGRGDEVIVPDLSFIATANAVMTSGATPVFADIDRETLCLCPDDLARRITRRTRAIIPVHLYGHPADMRAINEIAAKHALAVIEDAAQAHGATIEGRKVGSFGHCATFSFYGNKTITTGEGGMITTDDDSLNARCRHLRDHAMSPTRRYWHEELGYNYRMTNLQAAVGCAQLERAEQLLEARREIFDTYAERLGHQPALRLNRTAAWATNTYWLVCAEIAGLNEERRTGLMAELKRRGIDSRPYFYPMSDMPYMSRADTPVAHEVSVMGINLPTYVDLKREDIAYISAQLAEAMEAMLADA